MDRHYQTNNIEDKVRQSQIFWGLIFGRVKADIMHFRPKGTHTRCGAKEAKADPLLNLLFWDCLENLNRKNERAA